MYGELPVLVNVTSSAVREGQETVCLDLGKAQRVPKVPRGAPRRALRINREGRYFHVVREVHVLVQFQRCQPQPRHRFRGKGNASVAELVAVVERAHRRVVGEHAAFGDARLLERRRDGLVRRRLDGLVSRPVPWQIVCLDLHKLPSREKHHELRP